METIIPRTPEIIPRVNPQSWDDCDMNWDSPDPNNPAYLKAIQNAIYERLCVVPGGIYFRTGTPYIHPKTFVHYLYHNAPSNLLDPNDIYNIRHITFLRDCIFYIMSEAKIKTEKDGYNDYQPVSSVINHGEAFQWLCMATGYLVYQDYFNLFGKILKSFKYLLDQCTIFDLERKCTYDMWEVYPYRKAGDPEETSWGQLWDNMSGAAVTNNVDTTMYYGYDPSSSVKAYTSYDYMYGLHPDEVYELHYSPVFTHANAGGYIYVPYISTNVKLFYRSPFAFGLVFMSHHNFDFAGYGTTSDEWGTLAIMPTQDDPEDYVQLGSSPVTQPPWNPEGNIPNDDGEVSSHAYQSFYCHADYAVEGGFKFQ